MSEDLREQWLVWEKTGKRGASRTYSDAAIATVATVGSVFHLAGRQVQGFLTSLFELIGWADVPVADYMTVSRRLGSVSVKMPVTVSEILLSASSSLA